MIRSFMLGSSWLAEKCIVDTSDYAIPHVSGRIDTGEPYTVHRHHEKEERDEAYAPIQAAIELDPWKLKRTILLQQRKMVA